MTKLWAWFGNWSSVGVATRVMEKDLFGESSAEEDSSDDEV
jgi:hypothetical protein